MKRDTMLTVTSLLSILFLSFHLTQDAIRATPGTFPAGPGNLTVIVILLGYLCGTLLFGGRLGYVIKLLGGLLAAGMPILHLTSPRYGLVPRPGQFFFLWTMIVLGVLGLFSVILAVRGVVSRAGSETTTIEE